MVTLAEFLKTCTELFVELGPDQQDALNDLIDAAAVGKRHLNADYE